MWKADVSSNLHSCEFFMLCLALSDLCECSRSFSLKNPWGGENGVTVTNTWGDFCQKDLSWLFKAHGNKSASFVYKQEEGVFWYAEAWPAPCSFLISGSKYCTSYVILEVREFCDAGKYRVWTAFVNVNCKWIVGVKRQIHFPVCRGMYLFKALILHKGNTSFYLDFLANWHQTAQMFF